MIRLVPMQDPLIAVDRFKEFPGGGSIYDVVLTLALYYGGRL
jgi:hypothetical protein